MAREPAEPVTQFHLRELATRVGPVALVTIDNGADWRKPNTFGEAATLLRCDAPPPSSTRL
jgi:hypothetical protein